MARTPRYSSTGWFHVMNRGVASQPIVHDDGDRHKLLEVLERSLQSSDASVHAYCLMTNHYHLIVEADPAALATLLKRFGQGYTQAFNRRYDRIGPAFAGRYHDVAIESDVQLAATTCYVALNPQVIDRFDIDRYPWSSHGSIVTGDAPPWLTRRLVEHFGGVDGYRRTVNSGRSNAEQIVEMARIANDEIRGLRVSRDRDVRDVVLLLADAVDTELAGALMATLGFTAGNTARTARHRARRRSDELAPVVARLQAVVECSTAGAVPGSGDLR